MGGRYFPFFQSMGSKISQNRKNGVGALFFSFLEQFSFLEIGREKIKSLFFIIKIIREAISKSKKKGFNF